MTASAGAGHATRREWIGLAIIALPCIVYGMDLTVLNLAIPSISAALKPTAAQLLWIVDVYGFLAAGSLLIMGTLGDRIGRRKLLLIGSTCFGLMSVVAAYSRSAEMLIAARALLGIAAATMAPSTLSLISNMFRDDREKTFAVSVWIASFSFGGAIGPAVGGLILAHFWWGAAFLAPVPVMALLLIVGPALLPEYKQAHTGRLDVLSAVLSLAAVPVIYGIKLAAQGGSAPRAVATIALGTAVGALFVRRQSTLADPLLDLGLFRRPAVTAALTIYVIDFFVGFGILILVAQYLQLVLGLTPLAAGLWSTPVGFGFVAGSMSTSAALRLMRPAHLLAIGLTIAASGLAAMAVAVGAHTLVGVVGANVVFALGVSPCTAIIADLVVSAAPLERSGAASALSEVASEFGGAAGIALLGSLATLLYRSTLSATLPQGLPAATVETAMRGIGDAATLPANDGAAALMPIVRAAYTGATQVTLFAAAGIVLAAAVVALAVFGSAGSSR